jgi:hypothetical protein
MTMDSLAGDGLEEDALREAVEAGLASAREQALVEAAVVERGLRRELDALCEQAEQRKSRLRTGRGGRGDGMRGAGGWR